ncbi:MAG: glutamine-hydrolyzing carbamoyl-phosphate synthase small subunit [Gammaproteobacteria bacterium]|nr:glutamine-hydrolyzing carbamoyl-phosphate synthase small subunit [Gammaproteobacteria bacterium]
MSQENRWPFAQELPATLALEDGSLFRGVSIGAVGHAIGEVVFNTALTGYQEILTDPSYSGQIVTLTYPHIGNTGINGEDVESSRVHAAGLIIKDLPLLASNFRSTQSLADFLKSENIVGIAGIDTRRLTRILREKGVQHGAIVVAQQGANVITQQGAIIDTTDDATRALALAKSFPGLAGTDLAKVVSTQQPYEWTEAEWRLGTGYRQQTTAKRHVVVFDFGIKRNIMRMLVERGCELTVLPAQSTARDALAYQPDGIFLSNGPGDPEPCEYAISATRELIDRGIPVFGICLGHQIMALASGAKTLKMRFGHHGANHPVQDLDTKQVLITSQNHGFAVDAASLPANCRPTHVSLFDGSLQGLARTDRPAFCFQGHPEASPGPQDVAYLFDRFVSLMENRVHA